MALCGPKLSICGMVLGVWGTIMLALLGVFFRVKSPALVEDLPINETEWKKTGFEDDYVYELYDQTSINCWIASAIYIVVFVFSFIQHRINLRANYVMS